MKRLSWCIVLILVGLVFFGASEASAQKKKMKGPVVWQAADLKWVELPNTGGVTRAVLWGDPDKGAYGALQKFPAGTKFPLHYHSNPVKIIVISGTWLYTPEGGSENKLGPGSYLWHDAKDKHMSGAAEGSDCEVFIEQSGKFDMIPIEAPKK
jgi:quercetin dioxygenase-like cupin family protein